MEGSLSPLSSRMSRRAVGPKRSVAEGSAVPRTFRGNVFRPSVATCCFSFGSHTPFKVPEVSSSEPREAPVR